MKCTIMSLEAKVASNGNHYVTIVAQPCNDPFAEELKYRMWCSEALASRLEANTPEEIELRRATVKVKPFQRVSDDGDINPHVFDALTVTVRQFRGEDADDAQRMADKLRSSLLADGRICEVMTDSFDGAVGDIPEE